MNCEQRKNLDVRKKVMESNNWSIVYLQLLKVQKKDVF